MAALPALALALALALAPAPADDDAPLPATDQGGPPAPVDTPRRDGASEQPSTAAAPTPELDAKAKRRARWVEEGAPAKRRFLVGIAGVLMQVPPLRLRAVPIDPRDVGRTVALGGLGLFGRFRPRPIVGLELDIRSGSVRYTRKDADVSVRQDQLLVDVGALLYLGRGDVFQLALAGGLGGMATQLRYDAFDATGRQRYGAFTLRVGADAEFLLKRIAIVLSFRTYGIVTDRRGAKSSGAVLARTNDEGRRAPMATFSTMLSGSIGIAYRF